MNVKLTPEEESFISERVRSHQYTSAEGVISEGLRLIQAKEEYQCKLAELRRDIDAGWEQADRGELLDADQVFDEIIERNLKRPRPA